MKLIIERLNRTLVVATYSHRGLSSEDKLRLFSIKKPNTFPVYYCSEIQPTPPSSPDPIHHHRLGKYLPPNITGKENIDFIELQQAESADCCYSA
ncbi:MAG: hypothetical protein J6K02_09535 [Alistipes sp.]|uniref:hypothetical protein n=1 Tax=Alistipes sp. TaxID=1872444 RepID=UPI001B490CB1|nr:hypothetical protein [Alistipes sp.]MBP3528889.1 hypothetical protein [Alistipes sp.]